MSPTRRAAAPLDLKASLRSALATSERISQYLLESLPDAVWDAPPPVGEGRTIAAIVAHVHNVRVMWLKAAAKGTRIPAQLDKGAVTPAQARKALAASFAAVDKVVAGSLEGDGLIAHESHHRGQICSLARQLGHRLPNAVTFGMWEWNKRRQEAEGAGDRV